MSINLGVADTTVSHLIFDNKDQPRFFMYFLFCGSPIYKGCDFRVEYSTCRIFTSKSMYRIISELLFQSTVMSIHNKVHYCRQC